MKIDLCKIFGVEEEQHFWVKEMEEQELCEYYIKDNKIYVVNKKVGTYCGDYFDILQVVEIYYKKPAVLTENTRKWLELLKSANFKTMYIDDNSTLIIYKYKDNGYGLGDKKNSEYYYNIDLSFMEKNIPYDIQELLGDEKNED